MLLQVVFLCQIKAVADIVMFLLICMLNFDQYTIVILLSS